MLDYALLDAPRGRDPARLVRAGGCELNVTASAVSQRVKLLEERVGSVLVKRGQPCVATTSVRCCAAIPSAQLLEAELGGRMPALPGQIASTWPTLRVAVNDDSVATWFIDAVGPFCTERETLLDLVIDDRITPRRAFATAACRAR